MKKPGKCCFLVKKKRPREARNPKVGFLLSKENIKSKEIFKIKSENNLDYTLKEVDNRNNKKYDGFKIVGCEDHKIILTKLKNGNSFTNEQVFGLGIMKITKHKKIIKDKCYATYSDDVLDYDKFLEEFNKSIDKPDEIISLHDSSYSTHVVVELEDKGEISTPEVCGMKQQLKREKIRATHKIKKASGKLQGKLQPSKQLRKKKSKSKEDLFNINNFIIHPNQIKISHRICNKNIQTPEFKETLGYQSYLDRDNISVSSFSSVEDISDQVYAKFHDQYESREREWRETFFGDPDKKKKEVPRNVNDNTRTDISEGNFKIRIDL